MTSVTEVPVVSTLQLLLDAHFLQVSIREGPQLDPIDLMCWVTEIRNLTDRIKNKRISAFSY